MFESDTRFMVQVLTWCVLFLVLWYILRTIRSFMWYFNPTLGLLVFVGVLVAYRVFFNYLSAPDEPLHVFVWKTGYEVMRVLPNPYDFYEEMIAKNM